MLKKQTGFQILFLVGCVVCAGLILFEVGSISSRRPSPGAGLLAGATAPAAPEIRNHADTLSSPAQRGQETASSANDAGSRLRGVRLTGVVIGPDLRIAIFAVSGAGPRVLSEGDTLRGWRLESISPQRAVFGGPAGITALTPQPDAALARPPPPVAAQPSQPTPAMADAPAQPIAAAPIAVATVSTAAPVQTQGYPYYFPGYYPGDEPYSPWGWDSSWGWGNPWGWGWPVVVSAGFGGCWSCGFRGGFFRPGFRRFGAGHPGFVHRGFRHPGFAHASFGGGFRGGGRR